MEMETGEPTPTPTAPPTSTAWAPASASAFSPATPTEPRRRNRPALSCIQCRTRKIQCDRMEPCASCLKSKIVNCMYDEARRPKPRLWRLSPPGSPDETSATEGALLSYPQEGMMHASPTQGFEILSSQLGNESQPAAKDEKENMSEDEAMIRGDGDGEVLAQPQTAAEKVAQRRKMKRFRLSHQQTRFLMSEFAKVPYPDAAQRERLSREIPGLSPRHIQVWFQNRRAKVKRLTADDRDRMIRLSAVPDDFDDVQALHSPYGAVHGLGAPITSPASFGASSYADHMMQPLMVDVRRREGNDNLPPISLSPAFGSSISFTTWATTSTPDVLSPIPPSSVNRYSNINMPGRPSAGPRTSNPFAPRTGLDSGMHIHNQRPLRGKVASASKASTDTVMTSTPPSFAADNLGDSAGLDSEWLHEVAQGGVLANTLTEPPNRHGLLPAQGITEPAVDKRVTIGATLTNLEGPSVESQQTAPFTLGAARAFSKYCWNKLSGLWRAKIPPGQVQISWVCRCGDILRVQVPASQQRAATAFARKAAGPNADTVVAEQSPSPTRPGRTVSKIQTSTSTGTAADASSASGTNRSSVWSRPPSLNTVPSDEELGQPEPFTPAGTKKFMLLCVNTSGPLGIPQRKLANVDVTDVECGAEMFQRLRDAYYTLRSRRNPLLVPKTMHYVKFQLLFLRKSGECIGSYQVDSIPSRNEVLKQEYAFSPCPPRIGPLPLPPDIFMHGFLDPGDHLGPMAVEILPKKLWCQLRWDTNANGRYNVPAGWGFYIMEGINWPIVSWCAAVALLGVTVLTMAWSLWAQDVQGGTGLGQYCLAVLTVSVSVWVLRYTVRDGLS